MAKDAPPGFNVPLPTSGDNPFGLGQNGSLPVANAYAVVGGTPTGHPLTANEVMARFAKLDPKTQAQVQSLLYQAGFYPANHTPTFGSYGQEDKAAFSKAVLSASQSGSDLGSYLNQSAQLAQASGVGQKTPSTSVAGGMVGGGANYKITRSDPNELQIIADKVAQSVLGRKVTGAERAKYIGVVSAHQQANEQALNNATEAQNQQQFGASVNANDAKVMADATATNAGGVNPLDAFMSALGKQESGNPNAVNKDSGARGMYQIMPGNWSKWAKDAGLPAGAPQTAANQETVARAKVTEYYNKFGNWRDVATAWYGGPGAVTRSAAAKAAPQGGGKYPSSNSYADQVIAKFNAATGSKVNVTSVPNTYVAPMTTSITDVNPAADVEAQLRAARPVEAAAHDTTSVYSTLLSLVRGNG